MTDTPVLGAHFLIDTYRDWIAQEGVPIVEDFGLDLIDMEVRPWARQGDGVAGAFALAKGRGDFLDMHVLEIAPGQSGAPQRHLFEEVVYVLRGRGSTTIWSASGEAHSFEWGPKSLFALPLNAQYRHYNTSGREPARLVSVTNLPMMMNAFRNEAFIYQNSFGFGERLGEEKYFKGEGKFIPYEGGKHQWETNFVADISAFELQDWSARGAGGKNLNFVLADGTMHAHVSEMPVGTYKKGHRHGADFHVFAVTGKGYSLYWYEGDKDIQRFDWEHGKIFAPSDGLFHQHFNISPEPSRYLAVAYGSQRHPFTEDKKRTFRGVDVSLDKGGRQVEYENQDPRIHQTFLEEMAKAGIEPRMQQFNIPAMSR